MNKLYQKLFGTEEAKNRLKDKMRFVVLSDRKKKQH